MTNEELDTALESLRRPHHVNDEDCWYSCPQSGECCRDDAPMLGCDCGANRHNATLDTVVAEVATLRVSAGEHLALLRRIYRDPTNPATLRWLDTVCRPKDVHD